jgi:hypothetical protein
LVYAVDITQLWQAGWCYAHAANTAVQVMLILQSVNMNAAHSI